MTSRPLFLLGLSALLALPASAHAQETTGRAIVDLAPAGSVAARASAASAVAARVGARRERTIAKLGVVTFRPAPGRSLGSLVSDLRADPAVRSARPEIRFSPRYLPDDPALSTTETNGTPAPGMPVQWAIARENLPEAWDRTRGAGGIVAVIDSGIDARQPDLQPKIARAVNQGGGTPTFDQVGHGTHVASQACAATDNGIGLAGTGFDCKLIIERSDLSESSVAASVVDAVDHGADAINMSFGDDGSGPTSQAYVQARDYAYTRGVVIVAAAANAVIREQGQPANLLQPTGTGPDLTVGKGLVVTAANFDDERASFAGLGTQISLADYGQFRKGSKPGGIFGAFPGNVGTDIETGSGDIGKACPLDCRTTFGGDSRYAYLQGTSMATGRVSGIVALVKGFNPDLTAADVILLMKQTARGSTFSDDLGWGIVDAGAAVAAARKIDRTAPTSFLRAPKRTGTRKFTVSWTGRDAARPGLVASGLRRFDVYAARDSGRYKRVKSTKRTKIRFGGAAGARYSFYTVAVDKAGNREPAPLRADASTRVSR